MLIPGDKSWISLQGCITSACAAKRPFRRHGITLRSVLSWHVRERVRDKGAVYRTEVELTFDTNAARNLRDKKLVSF